MTTDEWHTGVIIKRCIDQHAAPIIFIHTEKLRVVVGIFTNAYPHIPIVGEWMRFRVKERCWSCSEKSPEMYQYQLNLMMWTTIPAPVPTFIIQMGSEQQVVLHSPVTIPGDINVSSSSLGNVEGMPSVVNVFTRCSKMSDGLYHWNVFSDALNRLVRMPDHPPIGPLTGLLDYEKEIEAPTTLLAHPLPVQNVSSEAEPELMPADPPQNNFQIGDRSPCVTLGILDNTLNNLKVLQQKLNKWDQRKAERDKVLGKWVKLFCRPAITNADEEDDEENASPPDSGVSLRTETFTSTDSFSTQDKGISYSTSEIEMVEREMTPLDELPVNYYKWDTLKHGEFDYRDWFIGVVAHMIPNVLKQGGPPTYFVYAYRLGFVLGRPFGGKKFPSLGQWVKFRVLKLMSTGMPSLKQFHVNSYHVHVIDAPLPTFHRAASIVVEIPIVIEADGVAYSLFTGRKLLDRLPPGTSKALVAIKRGLNGMFIWRTLKNPKAQLTPVVVTPVDSDEEEGEE